MTAAPIIYVIEPYGGSIRRHNSALPLLYPDDAVVTRGEGVFETLRVSGGRAHNVRRHVDRFVASAAAMELPEPLAEKWREATEAALAEFGDGEGKCTWTYTRGRESTGIPTAWVTVAPLDAETLRQRTEGVRAALMVRADAASALQTAQGSAAKTVNYAATMAALRAAAREGADDVIFLDAGGRVLEGSRSTVVTSKGRKLRTPQAPGIVASTMVGELFERAQEQGFSCKSKVMDVDYLRGADSVWLVSSTRGAVRVTHLDGVKLPKPAGEEALRDLKAFKRFLADS